MPANPLENHGRPGSAAGQCSPCAPRQSPSMELGSVRPKAKPEYGARLSAPQGKARVGSSAQCAARQSPSRELGSVAGPAAIGSDRGSGVSGRRAREDWTDLLGWCDQPFGVGQTCCGNEGAGARGAGGRYRAVLLPVGKALVKH
eukprot:377104-Prorocentrum_minimum.AAC.1